MGWLYGYCFFLSKMLSCYFLLLQQEVENFKKVHLISREQFDCLTPEPPVDPNQEVPPGPPRPQQSEDMKPHKQTTHTSFAHTREEPQSL